MTPHPTHPGPRATLAAYGPNDTRATKLVVAIFPTPNTREPIARRTWRVTHGDVRNDPPTAAEITAFVTSFGVRQVISPERILGCPHEEGVDYPPGTTCPLCPYWANLHRQSQRPPQRPRPLANPPASSPSPVGRNAPCPCGSGRKFKRCCGRLPLTPPTESPPDNDRSLTPPPE